MKTYKNINELQIRFNDVDIAGHVNNAIFQYYYDFGKLRFFDDVFKNKIDWQKEGFVLLKIEIEYITPVYLHDKIEVLTKISQVKNKSLIIEQIVREKGNNSETAIKSKASSVMVAYNYLKKQSMEIPNDWKKMISDY
jgi:acyl-CoA thioester hydrolase